METLSRKMRIAIPSKGRISENSAKLLKDAGLGFEKNERELLAFCENYDLDLYFTRASDIPMFVNEGCVDLGITGLDLIFEKLGTRPSNIEEVLKLGFGKCSLAIAVPQESKIENIKDLEGKTIATSFPNICGDYFKNEKIKIKLLKLDGSIEIMTHLTSSDAVFDIVSSGVTCESNGLKQIKSISSSEMVLIRNKEISADFKENLEKIEFLIKSVILARGSKYVVMNAPRKAIPKLTEKLFEQTLCSPTIAKLSKNDYVSISSVVSDSCVGELLVSLKKSGASGIIVMPIERMVI